MGRGHTSFGYAKCNCTNNDVKKNGSKFTKNSERDEKLEINRSTKAIKWFASLSIGFCVWPAALGNSKQNARSSISIADDAQAIAAAEGAVEPIGPLNCVSTSARAHAHTRKHTHVKCFIWWFTIGLTRITRLSKSFTMWKSNCERTKRRRFRKLSIF